jgi:hypothetical protein
MTAWTRLACAGDKLSARAIPASGRVVARSDEALEAVAPARARGYPDAYIASGEFANADIVLRLLAPCCGVFRMQQEDLALQPAMAHRRAAHGATRG